MLSETAETPVVGMLPVPVILNVRGVPPPAPSPILVVPTLPMFERVSATRLGCSGSKTSRAMSNAV